MPTTRAPVTDSVRRTRLVGELDLASAAQVTEHLAQLVHGGSRVVVDLSDVAFMDCAGLAPLMRAHLRAASGGGWVRLCGVQRGPMRVLLLTETTWLLAAPVMG